jgi:hypothetical protein
MRVPLTKDFPDHHDAELVLKTYELRRDPVLRESRKFITSDWWPKSLADVKAIGSFDHTQNAAFRQVAAYWELVYGLAKHGIVHAEYLADASGGEGFIFLAKVHPFLADYRQAGSPRFLRNTEWIATETETGREAFARLKDRVEQIRATR